MFYLIGLGLGDSKDITIKGLEIIKKCDRVYLEHYTSILTCGIDELEDFYGIKLITADRDLVEQCADEILDGADKGDVALLVVGDPYGATTHTDLILRAKEKNIKFQVVHNASILNAVGCCGLQLYSFGETVSIPFWTEEWKPNSFYDKILSNFERNLHTLCLLDIKVKEPTLESLTKKKKQYMPPRFMSVDIAAQQLIQIINSDRSSSTGLSVNSLCIGLARVGSTCQRIHVCTISEMSKVDLGPPLHSLVIPNPVLHPLEEEYLNQFKS
ncbi:hypothetical protein RN001_001520 [Aquatica leii]|uniref:diphthine methyl ester synthase n=1 Tax=Aquatica leii TaxID=1421715 RepID=A0AAN7PG19_9COLE|nr:hypothetical protein RN001_001520 [Aquatica leii]